MNLNFSEQMAITAVSAKPSNDEGEDGGDNILNVTLTLKVDDVQAKNHLGEEFHRLAFGRMQLEPIDGDTIATFDYKAIEIGTQLDDHKVKLLGYEMTTRPVIKKITQVKGERAVRVAIAVRAALTVKVSELGGLLLANLGDMTHVHFFEIQPKLKMDGTADTKVVNGRGRFGNNKPQTVAADATTDASH